MYDLVIPLLQKHASTENFYTDVHSIIIHSSAKVETTQMSIDWQMDK